jgi:hypothetical protein
VVVSLLERLSLGRPDHRRSLCVVERLEPPRDHANSLQDPPQRDHHMTGLQVTAGGLGQEWLVHHEGLGSDERDVEAPRPDPLDQAERRVQADVPAPDDEDPRRPHGDESRRGRRSIPRDGRA